MIKIIRPLLLIFSFILFIAIIAFSFIFYDKIDNHKITAVKADEIIQEDTAEKTGETETETENKSSAIAITMPILMYHHIRNFPDQNDKIGYNLSVTPEDFANQLDLIKSREYTAVNFRDIDANNLPEKPIILTFDDGYDNFYSSAYPLLKERNMTAVVYVISGFNKDGYLTSEQIKELSDDGIEIGSHTTSHPNLTAITPEKALVEVIQSKNNLEKISNQPVISFCYPAGKYNEEIIKKVEQNYKYAVTTDRGEAELKNPYSLARFRVNHGTNISSILK